MCLLSYSISYLQSLNCVGCPNIGRVHTLSEAKCMNLSLLNLFLFSQFEGSQCCSFQFCFLEVLYSGGSLVGWLVCLCVRVCVCSFSLWLSLFFRVINNVLLVIFSNCSLLEILKLECPKLSSLFLQVNCWPESDCPLFLHVWLLLAQSIRQNGHY